MPQSVSALAVLAELKSKGSEKTRAMYARHGNAPERILGVSVADMKLIAKPIQASHKKSIDLQQALACELYETGIFEAMYLAGMLVDGARMSEAQLQSWAEGAVRMPMISEFTVPWAAVESASARPLAMRWIASDREHVAAAGWCTFAGLVAVTSDEALDLAELRDLLDSAVQEIHTVPNRVRSTRNGFVIAVGSYVRPLLNDAKAAARRIGTVSVDVGDTACKVRLAIESIEIAEGAGKLGRKRKTIRC